MTNQPQDSNQSPIIIKGGNVGGLTISNKNSQDLSKAEDRKTFKTYVSGALALVLWVILSLTILAHLLSNIYFSWQLVQNFEPPINPENVKSAVDMVNDTAKTLYSFLGTLVTAVTAYYFNSLDESKTPHSK